MGVITRLWTVDIKGGPWMPDFEISVLRKDNDFGKQSYGWFGPDKLLISQSGGPNHTVVTSVVWDRLVDVAKEVASLLNEQERR